jgi:hypothetical protein
MTAADQYRAKGLQFATMANQVRNPQLQLEYAGMAEAYFRLALQAEKNQQTDLVYETPGTAGSSTA